MLGNVIIIGAGGRAKLATEIFEMCDIEVLGYISSEPKGTLIMGNPVLFSIEELISNAIELPSNNIFIGVGDNLFRKKIVEKFKKFNFNYVNCIHPDAKVSKFANFGKGNFVDLDGVIQNYSVLGNFNAVGCQAIIGHDSRINNFVNISPSSLVCGGAIIETLSVIGPKSIVLEKRKISYGTIVGAGAVVTSDQQSEIVVGGTPAKFLKKRNMNISYLK